MTWAVPKSQPPGYPAVTQGSSADPPNQWMIALENEPMQKNHCIRPGRSHTLDHLVGAAPCGRPSPEAARPPWETPEVGANKIYAFTPEFFRHPSFHQDLPRNFIRLPRFVHVPKAIPRFSTFALCLLPIAQLPASGSPPSGYNCSHTTRPKLGRMNEERRSSQPWCSVAMSAHRSNARKTRGS